jgi:hypothetical protein
MKKLIDDLFFKRETTGEPIDYPIPGQPRIMKTTDSSKKPDFNTWAIHIHTTVRGRKFKK